MNLGDKSDNELLFINFNQDFSCISAGSKHGYRIYNCEPFGKCYSKGSRNLCIKSVGTSGELTRQPMCVADDGTGIVEMLFCTSLVALVGAGEHPAFSPRHLQIINTKV